MPGRDGTGPYGNGPLGFRGRGGMRFGSYLRQPSKLPATPVNENTQEKF